MIESLLCLAILILTIAMYFIYDALSKRIERQETKIKELTTMIKDISGIKYQLMDFVGRIRSLEDSQNSTHLLYVQLSTELGQMFLDKNKRKTNKK